MHKYVVYLVNGQNYVFESRNLTEDIKMYEIIIANDGTHIFTKYIVSYQMILDEEVENG